MYTIHQVRGAWEVRDGAEVIKRFPLRIFEIHSDSAAYLQAVEFVRAEEGYGIYFDFIAITVKDPSLDR